MAEKEASGADRLRRHKAQVEKFYNELWNGWNYRIVGDVLAPDIVFHGSLGVQKTGHEGFIEYAEMVRAAFPDFHNTLEETIAEGDRLAACLTYRGTHRGEIFGIAPTLRPIQYIGAAIFLFREGLIARAWVLGDRLELLRQLTDRDPYRGE
jgi:predicted ester cyclase